MAQVCVTATNFVLTTSVDGHLKFWKKQPPSPGEAGIEFVKHFRAHLTPILAVVASVDGLVAATIASDGSVGSEGGQGSVKVFDVENFGAFASIWSYPGLPLMPMHRYDQHDHFALYTKSCLLGTWQIRSTDFAGNVRARSNLPGLANSSRGCTDQKKALQQ